MSTYPQTKLDRAGEGCHTSAVHEHHQREDNVMKNLTTMSVAETRPPPLLHRKNACATVARMTTTPTTAQMRTRANNAHRVLLDRLVDAGGSVDSFDLTASTDQSMIRGYMKARQTLLRWGCISEERGRDERGRRQIIDTLTSHGRNLVDVLEASKS